MDSGLAPSKKESWPWQIINDVGKCYIFNGPMTKVLMGPDLLALFWKHCIYNYIFSSYGHKKKKKKKR